MNKHTVFVAGKRFVLLSDDSEKYVRELASEVSDAITKIAAQNPGLDRRGAAILCALDYADDKYKEIENRKRLGDKAKPIIQQADKQSKQLRELKDRISQREKMIEELSDRAAELEKENKLLAASYDEKEKEFERLNDTVEIKNAENRKLREELSALRESLAKSTQLFEGKAEPKSVPEKKKGYTPMRQVSLFDDEN